VVDIYMPDFKCWDPEVSTRLMGIEDYPDVARAAVREMHRQVGDLVVNDLGIASRGLLVRHLVLPGGWAGTAEIVEWLAREISPDTFLNVMGQYRPEGAILDGAPAPDDEIIRGLRRRLPPAELAEARRVAMAAGLRRLDV
jgi:putative pyruvate formate lyase activating enzyme